MDTIDISGSSVRIDEIAYNNFFISCFYGSKCIGYIDAFVYETLYSLYFHLNECISREIAERFLDFYNSGSRIIDISKIVIGSGFNACSVFDNLMIHTAGRFPDSQFFACSHVKSPIDSGIVDVMKRKFDFVEVVAPDVERMYICRRLREP